ncbi:no vein-like, partial [Zea mays]
GGARFCLPQRPRSSPTPQSSPTRGSPTILPTTAATIIAHARIPHDPPYRRRNQRPRGSSPRSPPRTPPPFHRRPESIDPKLPLELELYPTHERDPDAHGGLGSSRRTGCLAPADVVEVGSSSRRVTSTGEPAASRTAPAGARSLLRASPVPRDSSAGAIVRRTPCAAAAIGGGVEAESTEREAPDRDTLKRVALLALGCCTAAAALGVARAAAGDSIKASGFRLWVAESLRRLGWPDDTVVFALATLPVIELRGAIPLGIGCGAHPHCPSVANPAHAASTAHPRLPSSGLCRKPRTRRLHRTPRPSIVATAHSPSTPSSPQIAQPKHRWKSPRIRSRASRHQWIAAEALRARSVSPSTHGGSASTYRRPIHSRPIASKCHAGRTSSSSLWRQQPCAASSGCGR